MLARSFICSFINFSQCDISRRRAWVDVNTLDVHMHPCAGLEGTIPVFSFHLDLWDLFAYSVELGAHTISLFCQRVEIFTIIHQKLKDAPF